MQWALRTQTWQGKPDGAPPSGVPDVPGYEILGELGRGGMGAVFKARQVSLGRVVALKVVLDGALAGPQERARFKAEAEAAAQLQHPHVVQVYEVGEHAGRLYFTMELCEGGSLAGRVKSSVLRPTVAADLVRRLTKAVEAAHERGIVHRDLKPANVLLGSLSTGKKAGALVPKIADFGIARRLDRAGQTQTGAVMGTPAYMAPEQAKGSKGVGPPADIYSLGAILYECLTGQPPFKAETAHETLLKVLTEEPTPPRQLRRDVPRDLDTICVKCLQKDPAKRYRSARALAADLGRFLEGRPISARPVGAPERVWRWAARNRALASALGGLAFALVAGFVVATALALHASASARLAVASAAEAEENRLRAEEIAEDAVASKRRAEQEEAKA